MNLRNITAGIVSAVNPQIPGVWLRSAGYATAASGGRTPEYDPAVNIALQVQALTGKDLKLIDSLNIQGVVRAAYVNANVQGVNRAANQGGDLLQFSDPEYGLQWWLVTVVLETWAGAWSKVGVTLQKEGPPP